MPRNNLSPAVLLPLTLVLMVVVTLAASGVAHAASDDHDSEQAAVWRTSVQSLDRVEIYNRYLQQLIENQETEKSALSGQLENYHRSRPEIVPLMTRMIESLGEFVELDLPFHLEVRRARVQELTDNMANSEMTLAEKFRQILDAYQAEMNYGRDIDATVGWLEAGGSRREVTFLRVGRLVLAYQSHDRAETGFFNPLTRQWQLLPDSYRYSVAEGLRIAQKQAAPDLLKLPVAAPVTAQ